MTEIRNGYLWSIKITLYSFETPNNSFYLHRIKYDEEKRTETGRETLPIRNYQGYGQCLKICKLVKFMKIIPRKICEGLKPKVYGNPQNESKEDQKIGIKSNWSIWWIVIEPLIWRCIKKKRFANSSFVITKLNTFERLVLWLESSLKTT